LGFTVPPSVAELAVTDDAEPVVTVGSFAAAEFTTMVTGTVCVV
jgi:hypothetical protein